jgi:hypothetical protein
MSNVKTIKLDYGQELLLSTNISDLIWDSESKTHEFIGELSKITKQQIIDHKLVSVLGRIFKYCPTDEVTVKSLLNLSHLNEINTCYWDYAEGAINNVLQPKCLTAKQSLLSLLQANNIDTSKEWVLILKK